MSQEQEYQSLARDFMELWQERMTAMMQDGEFLRLLLRMMQAGPYPSYTPNAEGSSFHASPFATAAGSTAYAPDARHVALDRIERSLASIEQRLNALEKRNASPRKKRSSTAGKSVGKTTKRHKAGSGRRA